MSPRLIEPAEVSGRPDGPGGVAGWLAALDHALQGRGPALLPLPGPSLAPAAVRDRLLADLRPAEPLADPAVALVVPTSGSTGEPKGVLLSAPAMRASAAATATRLGGAGTWVLALPLTHVAGLMVLVRSLLAGSAPQSVDLSGGFAVTGFADATARARSATSGALFTSLVPAQLALLLDAAVDLTGYDTILLGGAAAPESLLTRAAAAGATIVATYGMSETCGGCVYDGRPLEGVEVSLGVDGLIRLGGPTLYSGYRIAGADGLVDGLVDGLAEGLHRTADLGRLVDGRLVVLGRADDVIVSGGTNVVAGSVSRVLADHPLVRDVAVVGIPDPVWGERVVAVVAPASPGLTLADVREYAASRLESAAVPRGLVLVEALPLLTSGKPDRERLRRFAAAANDPTSTKEP